MKSCFAFILILFVIIASLSKAQNAVLYGMTDGGGAYSEGVIFNFDVSTGIESTLHNFGAGQDGSYPHGSLNRAGNGVLYGTTQLGGTSSGTLFSYTIATATENVINNFATEAPWGSLIQAKNGLLYGLTTMGGAYGEGSIYSYDISTATITDIYDFINNNTDAGDPYGALFQASDGLLYGTSAFGGNSLVNGSIFSYNISTGVETVVHSFASAEGTNPHCTFIQASDGLLYGTTDDGGGANSKGTIFSYNIATGVLTNLHNFGSGTDGATPFYGSLIQSSDGLLYGMTEKGGANLSGIIFSYNIATGAEQDIHDFGNGTDGSTPRGDLMEASNGLLYGMTQMGGANGFGIIFSFNPATTTETDLHDFSGTDGNEPLADLIEVDTNTVFATPIRAAICEGDSTTLTVNGAATYTWAPSAGLSSTTGSTVTASPIVTTTYTITGTINAHSYTTTAIVTVFSTTGISISGQSPLCPGESTLLTASGGANYTWSPATGLNTTTGDSVIANPTATITYLVTGTNIGGCASSGTYVLTVQKGYVKPEITDTDNVLTTSATQGNQWYRDGTAINGATGKSYTVTDTGCYWETATNIANGCSSISDTICIALSGINQLSVNSYQLSVYPNPTSDFIHTSITLKQSSDLQLRLVNMLGQTVWSIDAGHVSGYQNGISVADLADGVYLLEMVTGGGVETREVVVTH